MKPNPPDKPVNQNGAEPAAGYATVPIWLVMVFGAMFYWGATFLSDHGGEFNKDVYNPFESYEAVNAANPQDPEAKLMSEGRKQFGLICAACHLPTGLGQEGKAPPLAGSDWVQAPRGDRLVRIVLNGLTGPITVKGQQWNLTMPPWGGTFTDYQIAAVLTYVRGNLDNKAGPINPAVVTAARAEKHSGNETLEELSKIPVQ